MNINEEIINILKEKKLTISFCESATAGALSSMLCDVQGASKVFKGSLITYSNEAKINVAKVSSDTIKKFGAVSKQTALEMSSNTNKILKSDICISITGNSDINVIENKKVCSYYVGITLIDKTQVFLIELEHKERNWNRYNIAFHALSKLKELIF